MGICELETGLLSGKVACRQVPEPLLHSAELGRGELYVSPLSLAKAAPGLDRGDSTGFQICLQSAPADYALHAPSRRGRPDVGFCWRSRADAKGKQARTGAFPVAATSEARPEPARRFSRWPAQTDL